MEKAIALIFTFLLALTSWTELVTTRAVDTAMSRLHKKLGK